MGGKAQTCNTSSTPYTYFSHNSHGYLVNPGVKGPAQPCEAMKAVTEGGPPIAYQGMRTSDTMPFSRNAVDHADALEITFAVVSKGNDVPASRGTLSNPLDYLVYAIDCTGTSQFSAGNTFRIPACPCANAGAAQIFVTSADGGYEPPEVAKLEMTEADCTVDPTHPADHGSQSIFGGWVIQDECESGALLQYPDPLPLPGSDLGYTVQLATRLPKVSGVSFTPDFREVAFEDHLRQNYPYAASEVVAENSWLEFAVVLVDENATERLAIGAGAHQTFVPGWNVFGTAVQPAYEMDVTLDFLDRGDWNLSVSGCGAYPTTYDHYVLSDDVTVERHEASNNTWVPIGNPAGPITLTFQTNESLKRLRLRAEPNDSPPPLDSEPHEIAHLRVSSAVWVGAPPIQPNLRIGWSSDFRFVIQEDASCP